MQEKNQITIKIFSFILLLLIIIFAFYWYEWRPVKIRKQCNIEAKEKNPTQLFQKINMDYENIYKQCLRKNGVKK